ncbi:hypothetical protein AB3X83_04780 [Lentilactobacillus buchneri]
MLVVPMWLQVALLAAFSFWVGTQYVAWKQDRKNYWKQWFD